MTYQNEPYTVSTVGYKKVCRWPDIPQYYGMPFVCWALSVRNQRFAYTGVDAFGDIQQIHAPLCRRWSEIRQKRNLAIIYSFSENLPRKSDMYFATLTVRHPRYHTYTAQKQAIEDLRDAWDAFRIWLRKTFPNVRYLRVYEAGEKNGYAHIHLVVCIPKTAENGLETENDAVKRIPVIWCRCCKRIGNDALPAGQNIQKIDSESEIRNVGAYLSKYLMKTVEIENESENKEYWRWVEISYRMRLRVFGMDSETRAYVRHKYEKFPVTGVKGEFMILDESA